MASQKPLNHVLCTIKLFLSLDTDAAGKCCSSSQSSPPVAINTGNVYVVFTCSADPSHEPSHAPPTALTAQSLKQSVSTKQVQQRKNTQNDGATSTSSVLK